MFGVYRIRGATNLRIFRGMCSTAVAASISLYIRSVCPFHKKVTTAVSKEVRLTKAVARDWRNEPSKPPPQYTYPRYPTQDLQWGGTEVVEEKEVEGLG